MRWWTSLRLDDGSALPFLINLVGSLTALLLAALCLLAAEFRLTNGAMMMSLGSEISLLATVSAAAAR